ncbi:MAG TPA: DUF58 domain-containing protein [Methylomirabilota bacterium]|nr:DUF58 domain-containing protein [Methylomirabilota bacterium]
MAASPALRQRAEQLASTLPPLQVAAERIALTVAQGVHGRRRVGQGETFWQFRRYHAGDLINKIDWRKSAKSQYLFVREMEWAAAQSVWLWRDGSASMRYRSDGSLPEKLERAELLTIAVAALLVRGGERIALLGSGRRPATGQSALNRTALQLLRPGVQKDSLPAIEELPRHAHVVFVGDFLSPLAEIETMVRGFSDQGVHGHLLQVLDPAEEMLPFAGRVQFEGLEGEGRLLLSRVESVREAYGEKFEAHHQGLVAIARTVGWSFARTRTDSAPQTPLLALYRQLSDRDRR